MRLANMKKFLATRLYKNQYKSLGIALLGAAFFTVASTVTSDAAQATTIWQIAGQEALIFEYPDNLAKDRVARLNQRLIEIVAKLNPNQNWVVDILPTKTAAGKKTMPVTSAIIRLQGQPLLEITESDAKTHNAASVTDLANVWVRSLSAVFSQSLVRFRLTASIGMPSEVNYNGTTYYLKTEVAYDRGLFRTSGDRTDGKVIYWEIPANKAYQITANPYQSLKQTKPGVIFILNRNLQFVPYARQGSQASIQP
jgi:hypothetical protein